MVGHLRNSFILEFVPLSHSSTSNHTPSSMQSLDSKVFCRTCQELTYRELRYRSDFQFVGRLLVCQNCGETIFEPVDRKSTRLNSSHSQISYAVFCLKKK